MPLFRKIYLFLIDTIQSILIAASVFLVIYIFFFRPFQVTGLSMYPNFQDREYVLTNLITLRVGNPIQGDVVVFKAPPDPEKDFIKRVIGVAGDTIMLKDGDVYVNGQLFDQSSFLKPDVKTYGGSFLQDGQTITVPQGNFFVMGDNRPYSSDSREWGFVPQSNLIGKSFFAYWPLNNMGLISNPLKK
jgi:signal peptidase I